jgi:MFS family permease
MAAPALAARAGRAVIAAGALTLAAGHGLTLLAALDIGTHGSVLLLAPGLLLAGAGMGLCIGPLATNVLAAADPRRAGAVAGALSTAQQVGNSLGVALIGLVFFTAARAGYGRAFEDSLATLAALLVGVAACARLLPRKEA